MNSVTTTKFLFYTLVAGMAFGAPIRAQEEAVQQQVVQEPRTAAEAFDAVKAYLKRYIETHELDTCTLGQICEEFHRLLQPLIKLDKKLSKRYTELAKDLLELSKRPIDTVVQRVSLKAACLSAFNKHVPHLPAELNVLMNRVKKKAAGL